MDPLRNGRDEGKRRMRLSFLFYCPSQRGFTEQGQPRKNMTDSKPRLLTPRTDLQLSLISFSFCFSPPIIIIILRDRFYEPLQVINMETKEGIPNPVPVRFSTKKKLETPVCPRFPIPVSFVCRVESISWTSLPAQEMFLERAEGMLLRPLACSEYFHMKIIGGNGFT